HRDIPVRLLRVTARKGDGRTSVRRGTSADGVDDDEHCSVFRFFDRPVDGFRITKFFHAELRELSAHGRDKFFRIRHTVCTADLMTSVFVEARCSVYLRWLGT